MSNRNVINKNDLQFIDFLYGLEDNELEQNTTATGITTIKQTKRNQLRAEGVKALLSDLKLIYGDDFDILQTKEGIVFTVMMNDETLLSWELKSTIKALDFDPYIAAEMYETEQEQKSSKREARIKEEEAKRIALEAKRQAKLAEQERKRQLYNSVLEEKVRK